MFRILLLVLVVLCHAATASAAPPPLPFETSVVQKDGTKGLVALAYHPKAGLHVAWVDGRKLKSEESPTHVWESADVALRVARFDGKAWKELPVVQSKRLHSGAVYDFKSLSLAVTGLKEVFVAWHTESREGTDIFLRRFDGTRWREERPDFNTGPPDMNTNPYGENVTLRVDAEGRLVIAKQHGRTIYIARRTAKGWKTFSSGQGSSLEAEEYAIALDQKGNPIVAENALTAMDFHRWDGTQWISFNGPWNEPPPKEGEEPRTKTPAQVARERGYFAFGQPSIEVDAQGRLVLAVTESILNEVGRPEEITVRAYRWDGKDWSSFGSPIEGEDAPALFSPAVVITGADQVSAATFSMARLPYGRTPPWMVGPTWNYPAGGKALMLTGAQWSALGDWSGNVHPDIRPVLIAAGDSLCVAWQEVRESEYLVSDNRVTSVRCFQRSPGVLGTIESQPSEAAPE